MTAVQYELGLSVRPVRADPDLVARLRAAGVGHNRPISLHTNRRVMISVERNGALRVHAGYAYAPDDVVAALATWARPRVRRIDRRTAARIFLRFPVHQYVAAPAPRSRPLDQRLPGDEARIQRLVEAHLQLNLRWFGGALAPIAISLSSRMRRKLGHYEPSSQGAPRITISRRHLKSDGWTAAYDTLLHEMVHQWQDERGFPVDHGRRFRAKALEVGIEPSAVRKTR